MLDHIEKAPEALDKFMIEGKEVFAVKESGYTLEKKDCNPEVPDTEYSLLIKTQGFDRNGNPHDILLSYDIRLDGMGTIEHKSEPIAHSIRQVDRLMSLPKDWNGHLELRGFRTNDNGEPERTDDPEFYTVFAKRENGGLEPVVNIDNLRDATKYTHQITRQFEYQGKQRGIDFDFDLLKNPDHGFETAQETPDRPLGERNAESEQGPRGTNMQGLSAMEPTEETRAECTAAMEAAGMQVTGNHPIFDGKGHRIDVDGDKPRQGSGWYIGFTNGRPGGVCVNNRTNVRVEWSKSRGYKLTENKKRELNGIAQAKRTTYQKERDAKQEQALVKLHGMIEKTFVKPTEPTPYLEAKMLPMDPGIYQNKGSTCVPIHDVEGNVHSMAYIQANGTKRYAKDCDKFGHMYVFGGTETLGKAKAFIVGEGYSTVASAYHATKGMEVANIAGFDSTNTKAVIEVLRERFPETPIINLGDDDKHLELRDPPLPNQGRHDAEDAAKKIGNVTAVFPIWPKGTPVDKDHTDFDDLRRMNTPDKDNVQDGFEAVRSQLQPVIERAIEQAQENMQVHRHEKTRGSLVRD